MDAGLINAKYRECQELMTEMQQERSSLVGTRSEIEDRIETLDCMIAAEEGKAQELSRHLPAEKAVMSTPSQVAPPQYRG